MNYYLYWEGRKINYVVAYVHKWHKQIMDVANGKEVIISETGWPSCGKRIGDAIPSPENAGFYFLNFVSWARANNVKYFYFEAFDECWKAGYEGPQGACWEIWNKYGNMKPGYGYWIYVNADCLWNINTGSLALPIGTKYP